MNDHDSIPEPAAVARPRRRRLVVAALAAVAAVAAFASFLPGRSMLADVPVLGGGLAAAAAPFDDAFPADWRSGGLYDRMIGAVMEFHADRVVRHLAVEIDASPQQQDKLRAIVGDAVKDLMPVRERLMAARATARDLLTRETVDRAAIEQLGRSPMIIFTNILGKEFD